jgi:hypothetical protein
MIYTSYDPGSFNSRTSAINRFDRTIIQPTASADQSGSPLLGTCRDAVNLVCCSFWAAQRRLLSGSLTTLNPQEEDNISIADYPSSTVGFWLSASAVSCNTALCRRSAAGILITVICDLVQKKKIIKKRTSTESARPW